jgi:hypothetical protein
MSMNFLKRACFSLQGHIVLSELFFSLPLFLAFLSKSYSKNQLTVEWALYLAIVSAAWGVLGAACFWYLVSLPLIKGQQDDRRYKRKRDK